MILFSMKYQMMPLLRMFILVAMIMTTTVQVSHALITATATATATPTVTTISSSTCSGFSCELQRTNANSFQTVIKIQSNSLWLYSHPEHNDNVEDENNFDSINTNSSNSNTMMMKELSWRAAKVKLEEENKKQMLQRRPRKLSYIDARRWVQYNLGPETKEEFDDLVANGNLRTPYIPKRPEEYYTETGDWVSWEHFLTMDRKVLGKDIPPATGRYD